MTPIRVLSSAFGLLMVAAVALQADAPALTAAAVAAVAVLVSVQWPWSATLAVVACVASIALSDVNPVITALAGLNATCYLLLCHAGAREVFSRATIVGALGCSALGLVATSIPAQLPWVPLAAPLAVLAMFVLVAQPLRLAQRRAQSPSGP